MPWARGYLVLGIPRRESVTRAAHGLHQPLQKKRLERLTQSPNVHVHRTLFDISITPPDPVEQLTPREDALRVGHEEMQQAVFGGSQGYLALARAHAVTGIIELESLYFHRVCGAGRRPLGAARLGCARGVRAVKTAW